MPIEFDSASLGYTADLSAVVRDLSRYLPADRLLTQTSQLMPYECDGLSAYRQLPRAVLLPENDAEVAACLRICHQHRMPVVTRGGGTSLSGGSTPHPEGVVLSLAKMMHIHEINVAERLAIVEPGVRNLAVSEAASVYGLYYAPDPSSQLACTIGGNVAENAGGVHCLKYGLTVHNVLAVSGFLMDGSPIAFSQTGLESSGLDFLALMHGSEGQLMVVTKITLKLLPKPAHTQVLLAGFPTVAAAGNAVAEIIAAGIIPAGLEMMDNATIQAVEPFVMAGYPMDAAALLIAESDGLSVEVEAEINAMKEVLSQAGATTLRVSQNEAERKKIWSGRKGAFPAVGRMTPDYYCMDGSIPRRHIAKMLSAIAEMEKKYALRCVNVFHAGDGNLHPLICYDSAQEGNLQKAEDFGAEILELSIALGGSVTGEHGVGLEKINHMCVQFSKAELAIFHGIREVLDAHRLLNPGKAIPTLNRCAEFGHLHVHAGKLPHPEIPRF
jgi:glycolate oxidase